MAAFTDSAKRRMDRTASEEQSWSDCRVSSFRRSATKMGSSFHHHNLDVFLKASTPFYTHWSAPLPEVAAGVLKHSNNLSAELIGQVTARKLTGPSIASTRICRSSDELVSSYFTERPVGGICLRESFRSQYRNPYFSTTTRSDPPSWVDGTGRPFNISRFTHLTAMGATQRISSSHGQSQIWNHELC